MMSDFRGGGGGSKMTQKNWTSFMHDPLTVKALIMEVCLVFSRFIRFYRGLSGLDYLRNNLRNLEKPQKSPRSSNGL